MPGLGSVTSGAARLGRWHTDAVAQLVFEFEQDIKDYAGL